MISLSIADFTTGKRIAAIKWLRENYGAYSSTTWYMITMHEPTAVDLICSEEIAIMFTLKWQ